MNYVVLGGKLLRLSTPTEPIPWTTTTGEKQNSANFDSVHCIGNLWPTYNGNPIRRLPIVCVCVSLEKCKSFAVLTKDNSKSHNCYRYLTFKMQTFFVVCVLNEHAVRWMHVERSIHLLQWLRAVVFCHECVSAFFRGV